MIFFDDFNDGTPGERLSVGIYRKSNVRYTASGRDSVGIWGGLVEEYADLNDAWMNHNDGAYMAAYPVYADFEALVITYYGTHEAFLASLATPQAQGSVWIQAATGIVPFEASVDYLVHVAEDAVTSAEILKVWSFDDMEIAAWYVSLVDFGGDSSTSNQSWTDYASETGDHEQGVPPQDVWRTCKITCDETTYTLEILSAAGVLIWSSGPQSLNGFVPAGASAMADWHADGSYVALDNFRCSMPDAVITVEDDGVRRIFA